MLEVNVDPRLEKADLIRIEGNRVGRAEMLHRKGWAIRVQIPKGVW